MLKFWKGVVAGSGAGVKDLPYNIGEPYSSAWGSLTHCRGTSKDDGSLVSIFSLSGSNAQDGHLAAGRNGVKRLHTTMQPSLVFAYTYKKLFRGHLIITQERLNRITDFVSEVTLMDHVQSVARSQDQTSENIDSPDRDCSADWKASAILVDCVVALTAAAVGIILDNEVPSFSISVCETLTSESVSATEASDFCQAREIGTASRKNSQYFDDYASETSKTRSDGFERMNGSYGNGQTSLELGPFFFSKSRTLERVVSSESLFSSVRSTASEDEGEEVDSENDKNNGDDVIMNWARIICGYHSLPLPPRGSETVFQPLEHLQAIKYSRPAVSDLGLCENFPDIKLQGSLAAEVNVRLAAAEEGFSLSVWTTATVCRVLSLESVLALFAGVLLEKQVVVVCPNLGVLSAVVLSLIPMIRPFQWQSLLLPARSQCR